MKALLLIFLMPTAESSSRIQPDLVMVEISDLATCEAYAAGVATAHSQTGDPRKLTSTCIHQTGD